ncbi:MAG: radical SAM protein [Candidatus Marinimicrobia bacterium]|nr:radical SAM protein [Candidatus Neomarinimicrobiota bacterium]
MAKGGYREIILLGQNVNRYGQNLKPKRKFSDLLCRLHQIKGIKKISFITSNPWDLTDDLIEAMSLPKIDRQLHLPVQSGDDQVLKKMNRPYTALQYLKLVEKIKNKIPEIKISTDIIVGFPGETKEAFENTVKLCKKVNFTKAYIAKYSPRLGTAAFKINDNVSPEEKKRRWQFLEELINQK